MFCIFPFFYCWWWEYPKMFLVNIIHTAVLVLKFLYSKYTIWFVCWGVCVCSFLSQCTLPYFGYQSEKLRIELSKWLSKYFWCINFHIIHVNNYEIGSLFSYKDKLPISLQSSLVYKFSCTQCVSEYVGSTMRMLHTRVAEHAGKSFRTGALLTSPPHSNIIEPMHSLAIALLQLTILIF